MKIKHFTRAVYLLLLSMLSQLSFATGGSIMGQVTDSATKEPVSFVTVILMCQGNQTVFSTNDKGFYYADNIAAGNYSVTVSYLSKKSTVAGIKLADGETREINLEIGIAHVVGPDVIIQGPKSRRPQLDKFDPTTNIVTRDGFKNQPILKVNDLLLQAGIPEINGEYYVSGARSGSLVYYIDDCRVMGNPDIPLCGVEMVRTYSHFIPARYGDTTGGVVDIETRNWFTE